MTDRVRDRLVVGRFRVGWRWDKNIILSDNLGWGEVTGWVRDRLVVGRLREVGDGIRTLSSVIT